mgnify:CR=1 FL=1
MHGKNRGPVIRRIQYRLKIAMLFSLFLILVSIKATLTGMFSV